MAEKNIVARIVERRKEDIRDRGFCFGHSVPEKRTRPVTPFMQDRGVILEVKRASPSKGDIAPDLDPALTARAYCENGASAISCLTEENYFKGTLEDLRKVCDAVDEFARETGRPAPAVLRKDFLIDEEEIEVAYRCGADAVLLISGILPLEKMLCMTERCRKLGMRALVEVRTEEDARKVLEVKKQYPDTIVCGVNSRNLRDFTIDLMAPLMLKDMLGGRVIFESGITTPEAAQMVGSMGFAGILLGEYAARNPEKAGAFVRAFEHSGEGENGRNWLRLSSMLRNRKSPLVKVCGLTRAEDVLFADGCGIDLAGFIFASGFGRNVAGERFEKIREVLPRVHALKVAVITDPSSAEAQEAASLVRSGVLDMLQFHGMGREAVPDSMMALPHYFAVTDREGSIEEKAGEMFSLGEPRFLQDCRSHRYSVKDGPVWIAGGINPGNAASLVQEFQPELVDVSGGVEDSPEEGGTIGVKNHEKVRTLLKEIKRG